jgi:hypothetical protein
MHAELTPDGVDVQHIQKGIDRENDRRIARLGNLLI